MQIKKPANKQELILWEWADFQPGYTELNKQIVTTANVEEWLSDWSLLYELGDELASRLYVATSVNTADQAAEKRFAHFMEKTYPGICEADLVGKRTIAEENSHLAARSPLDIVRAVKLIGFLDGFLIITGGNFAGGWGLIGYGFFRKYRQL